MKRDKQSHQNHETYSESFSQSFEHVSINEGKSLSVTPVGGKKNLLEIPRGFLSVSQSGDDMVLSNKKTHESITVRKDGESGYYIASTQDGDKRVFITNQGVDSRFHPEFNVPRMTDDQIAKFYFSVYNPRYEMVSPEFAKMALDVGINKWYKKLNRNIVEAVKELSGIDIFLGNKVDKKDCFSNDDLKVMSEIENQHGDHALSVALAAKGNFDDRNKRNISAIPGVAMAGLSAEENLSRLKTEKLMYEELVKKYDADHLPKVQKGEAIAISGQARQESVQANSAGALTQEGTDKFNNINVEFLQGVNKSEDKKVENNQDEDENVAMTQ